MSVTYGYNTKLYIAGEPITATAATTTIIVIDEISDFNPQQYKSIMKSRKSPRYSEESEKHQRLARMRQRGPDKRGAWWNGKRRW